MDGIERVWSWPAQPYRGLDFYREEDASLFRERDEDVQACAQLLTGFGTKLLLLQGYSGVGKSSFLRAGLIPYLKPRNRPAWFFLPGSGTVIRCTADPLYAIATALIAAMESEQGFVDTSYQEDYREGPPAALTTTTLRPDVSGRLLADALNHSRKRLARVVLEALTALSANLPGKLVLVLDQGEEVITQGAMRQDEDGPRPAFFRLLEGIYLRNVDVRVIIALRTEYYGRFRDELRIRDDRLSSRPKSGGVEPFLLKSFRKKTVLRRTIAGPTSSSESDGNPHAVYNFTYTDGVVERIVDDLLDQYPNASVTPALQLVCSSLYERLTADKRQITHQDYTDLKGVAGIVESYVDRGIAAIHPRVTREEANRWRLLLHSLVCRQGGGVVVSLAERQKVLVERAKSQFELESGDQVCPAPQKTRSWSGVLRLGGGRFSGWNRPSIASALENLTRGATPLLRCINERPDAVLEPGEQEYSLKHDTIAAALARWHDQHGGAIKAALEERRKRWIILWASAAASLVISISLAYVFFAQGQDFVKARDDALSFKNIYAQRAPAADYRLSLLLLLANLSETSEPANLYEQITGANQGIHAKTKDLLKETLPRVPWFPGHYQAAGFDPTGDRIALLKPDEDGGALEILTLPVGDTISVEPRLTPRSLPGLPQDLAKRRLGIAPTVGFVKGLGPVVSRAGMIYFWDREQQLQERDLWAALPSAFTADTPPQIDFVAGTLQIRRMKWEGGVKIWVLRLDRSNIEPNPPIVPQTDPPLLTERNFGQPLPVFSDGEKFAPLYGYFEQTKPVFEQYADRLLLDPRVTPLDPAKRDRLMQLDLVFGQVNNAPPFRRIAVAEVPPDPPYADRLRYTMGFANNAAAVAFKLDLPEIEIYDLTNIGFDEPNEYVEPLRLRVKVPGPALETIAQPANVRILYPLLALSKISEHWRAAWLATSGVQAVESSDADPQTAQSILGGLLISGTPGGNKLTFTPDGNFLILLQQPQWHGPADIRVWDLRAAWKEWLGTQPEENLRSIACRILAADGSIKFKPEQMSLFKISPTQAEPCLKRGDS